MKVAIVGLGPHGKRLAKVVEQVPGLSLAAVVDRSEQALGWGELPSNIGRFKDAGAAWASGVDMALISTNGPSHAPLAIGAMRAGVKRVMVEKPMACSVRECRDMITTAKETGARLAVNQSRRHDPLYRWVREKIRSGEWGQPRTIWIQRPGIGLGCLGTHYFDLIRFLSDREVTRVTAWIDDFIGPNPRGKEFVDPGGLVVAEMGLGLRGVVAQIEDGAGPMSVEIDMTAARIRVDEQQDRFEVIARDLSVKPAPGKPAVFSVQPVPEELRAKTDVSMMAKGVLENLASDQPLECDPLHGLASIEVLAAAYLSHQQGNMPVNLPLSDEGEKLWLSVT